MWLRCSGAWRGQRNHKNDHKVPADLVKGFKFKKNKEETISKYFVICTHYWNIAAGFESPSQCASRTQFLAEFSFFPYSSCQEPVRRDWMRNKQIDRQVYYISPSRKSVQAGKRVQIIRSEFRGRHPENETIQMKHEEQTGHGSQSGAGEEEVGFNTGRGGWTWLDTGATHEGWWVEKETCQRVTGTEIDMDRS